MTAGTVVITGGILAAVILLCIIAVLCYCRLQYYCCKKNDSEADVGSAAAAARESRPHFACNVCSAPGLDGPAVTPLSLEALEPPATPPPPPPRGYCPTCSPYYLRGSGLTDEMRNGGERLGFHTYRYDDGSPPGAGPGRGGPPLSVASRGPSPPPLSFYSPADDMPLPGIWPYSTQV